MRTFPLNLAAFVTAAVLVINRGVVFHRESVLPVRYVREISDGVVRVQISPADLKALETFE